MMSRRSKMMKMKMKMKLLMMMRMKGFKKKMKRRLFTSCLGWAK